METPSFLSLSRTLGGVILLFVASTIYRGYLHRKRFRNLPGPPHSWITGHLIPVIKVAMKLPSITHPHSHMPYVVEAYDLPPVFYVDLWPVRWSMMVICDPETSQYVTKTDSLPKFTDLAKFLTPIAGRDNLVSADGEVWRKWRAIFNPTFSPARMMEQVPAMVEYIEQFKKLLDTHAQNCNVFRLEEDATKLTVDIIGKVVTGYEFNSLTAENEYMNLLRHQLSWFVNQQSFNPLHDYNPVRWFAFWYYKRKLDNYVGRILDERFSVRNVSKQTGERHRTGLDLALEAYFKENGQTDHTPVMDPEFRRYAIDNIHILLFAGHDTTASTICYSYYLLSKHPEKLAKLREELDRAFGTSSDSTSAAKQLSEKPHLVNDLHYTAAVVRETLRLWPPASSARNGKPGYFVKDPVTGSMLDTEGLLVWPSVITMQRSRKLWGADAWSFQPERFLPENADSVPPNAWRPFEKGPRNCIGQDLALLEVKLTLALTVREYDFSPAYEELQSLEKDGSLWSNTKGTGPQEVFDDPAYQILLAAAKPREGMPMRVKRRN